MKKLIIGILAVGGVLFFATKKSDAETPPTAEKTAQKPQEKQTAESVPVATLEKPKGEFPNRKGRPPGSKDKSPRKRKGPLVPEPPKLSPDPVTAAVVAQ